MTRRLAEQVRELDRSSPQSPDEPLAQTGEKTKLWSRFRRVRAAVAKSLTSQTTPGVNRELKTFHWSGYDAGIHDHKGRVEGLINGITLELFIEGSTIDNQQQIVVAPDGQWMLQSSTDHYLEINRR